MLGVDRPVERAAPAKRETMILAAPKTHPARRKHAERQRPVADLDQIDAVAPPAAQRPLLYRPVVRRRQVQPVVADGQAVEPDVGADVGQGPGLEACHRGQTPGIAFLSGRSKNRSTKAIASASPASTTQKVECSHSSQKTPIMVILLPMAPATNQLPILKLHTLTR